MTIALVDTHCHLDLPDFDHDRVEVLERARRAGVVTFVLVGFAPNAWDRAIALAERTPGMVLALGVHPNQADEYDAASERRLRHLLTHPLVRAVGEIGLDYYWKTVEPRIQAAVFQRQLDLAAEYDLPIVLHQREAHDDLLAILERRGHQLRGVMHCFTGDASLASRFLDLGLHLGIGGVVTYRSAQPLRDAVRDMPLERLLLETDAPYLAPVPYRGKRNEPCFLRFVLDTIAQVRAAPVDEVAHTTTSNARRLFRLDGISTVSSAPGSNRSQTTGG